MDDRLVSRIMMISTHGYVAAEPEFGKPDTGGQVVYVLELARCLGRMGFHVDILTRQFEDQPAEDRLNARVRIIRLPCGGSAFIPKEHLWESIPEWVTHAVRWIRAEKTRYSMINSHYWDAGIAGQALADRFQWPHVHTPHSIGAWKRDNMDGDPSILEQKYNFRRRILEEKKIYQNCDLLIATTPVQKEILLSDDYRADAAKIQVIPPGYDDQRFFPVSPATRQLLKHDLGFTGPVVLALGRVAENKGYDLLLQAMPVVLQRIPKARLVLAIGGSELTESESKAVARLKVLAESLGIAGQVEFQGFIPDEQLADYYRAADVFALSSRYEPFGMTAIEAMACGTPTVVTTEGGLAKEVAWGIEALYANPFDPPAFGHAIAAILQQPRIAGQLAKFGPRRARARFTWSGVAQQLLASLETNDAGPFPKLHLVSTDELDEQEISWQR